MKTRIDKLNVGDVFKWGNNKATVVSKGLPNRQTLACLDDNKSLFRLGNHTCVEVVEHETTFGELPPGAFFKLEDCTYIKVLGEPKNAIQLVGSCWYKDTIADDTKVTMINGT